MQDRRMCMQMSLPAACNQHSLECLQYNMARCNDIHSIQLCMHVVQGCSMHHAGSRLHRSSVRLSVPGSIFDFPALLYNSDTSHDHLSQ